MAPTRTLTTTRLENAKPDFLYRRDYTLDGRTIRIVTTTLNKGQERVERSGERYATPEEASKRLEQLLASDRRRLKTEQRLEQQVPVREEGLGTVAENPELERALQQQRDEASARVWADWLQSRGDPRGELAALLQAGQEASARALIDREPDRFFGEFDLQLDDELSDLQFAHGVLDGLTLKRTNVYERKASNLGALTRGVLALPIARFVRRLRFGLASYESDNDWTDTMRAVVESKQAPFLTSLRFDDYGSEDCELSWTPMGDFSFAWAALPSLKELVIRSGQGGVLGVLALPALQRFTRISGGLAADELEAITTARWPRLEHLEVWTGQAGYGAQATVERLLPLLEGAGTPALTSLGLVNCEIVHECLEPLASSRLLPRLKRLDLSRGALQDDDVELLIRLAPSFRHLEVLDLSENQLESGGERIKAVLPNAQVESQREVYEAGERYTAVGE